MGVQVHSIPPPTAAAAFRVGQQAPLFPIVFLSGTILRIPVAARWEASFVDVLS